ncbi:MAG: FG-GAP-like repeat-containing protein [Flavobacteriales bacterium]|nr:FG-GAP-like repeat-containing protein [Flavobacteriales bacterium]
MKHLHKNAALAALLLGALPMAALSQITFTNATSKLSTQTFKSGVGITVADMDGDGLDDIARMNQGYILSVQKQVPGQTFVNIPGVNMGTSSAWSMVVGDATNSGNKSVVAGFGSGANISLPNATGTGFLPRTTLPSSNYFLQNMNMMDVDNDGDLDIFGCNDVGLSKIWVNDGSGTFTVSNIINFNVTPDIQGNSSTDDSGNYGSVWSDFDNDGDIDLYVAKCRQGVNSSSDPRRINLLFRNNGDGTYTESAADYGLDIGAQTWTANWDDINNDGWFDLYLTNHDVPNQLFLNNQNGTFTNINAANGAGLNIAFTPYQSKMADFDNDGFIDILVTGSSGSTGTSARLYKNNGNNTFSPMLNAFPTNKGIQSFGVGDLNHDGKLDIYAGYATGYTTPSTTTDDILWLNNTQNENHFVSYHLQGTASNRDAVGARIFLYGPWGVQTREVRAGESYGNANSFHLHFGLGTATVIDSAVINWPSGNSVTLTNQEVDQFYHVVENTCVSPVSEISYVGSPFLCAGQTVTLSAPSGPGYTYLWSTGETTQTIQVSTTGEFSVKTMSGACGAYSPIVTIEVSPDQTPTITAAGDTRFCEGGSVTLEGPSGMSAYNWSNGAQGQTAEITQSGTYTLTITGFCQDFTSAPIEVEVLSNPTPAANGATVVNSGSVTLNATAGNNVVWYSDASGTNQVGTGNTFTTPVLTQTTTYYIQGSTGYPGEEYFTGQTNHSGTSQFSGSNATNATTSFDVLANCVLASVKVYTDTEGERLIQVKDQGGNVVAEALVNIPNTTALPDGSTRIDLNFNLTPGSYTIGTDAATNNTNFSFNGPRLQRSNGGGVSYPYSVPNIISLTGSSEGSTLFYYFYDWEIEAGSIECVSELVPVTVNVVSDASIAENAFGLSVYPNPTNGMITIKAENGISSASLKLVDITGKVVYAERAVNLGQGGVKSIDLSSFAAGIYTLEIANGDISTNIKVIKK